MASPTFPVFHDESGYVAPMAEPRPKSVVAGRGGAPAFQDMLAEQATTTASPTAAVAGSAKAEASAHEAAKAGESGVGTITPFAEGDTPSFWDVLDFINPLQHIPIINTIYREITGDKIGAVASIAGGALLGGPIGLGLAVANLTVRGATGQDVGEHVIAMFREDEPVGGGGGTRFAKQEGAPPAAALADQAARPVVAVAPERRSHGTIDVQFRPVPPRGSMAVPTGTHTVANVDKVPPIAKGAAVAPPAPAVAAGAPSGASTDWFVNRFTEAMDRYDQAHKPKQPDEKL